MTVEVAEQDSAAALLPVERGYINVVRIRTLLSWVPVLIGGVVLDQTVIESSAFQGALSIGLPILALITAVTAPPRIWKRLGYQLTPSLLQVVRGWLFHTDTIVPFIRVQHIDVTRGPLDKMFGTATLVVHTAGTHNSIVTLPGLAPERASEIRDLIRGQIRSDLE
ncbi:PH domain-containing protein [Sphingomonas arenae]|uniref:PH domain-containing protein n=1 Tax=Sphingomonas arenae TaxID=2812555 RepID=UPI001967BF85|nr:PH domain-containing protein [Sphingomonas arenae]